MAGFLGVIFDFYGSVRFGKENKCRARAGPLLAVAGASVHSATAPGRVSTRLDAVGSSSSGGVRTRPLTWPVATPQVADAWVFW